MKLKDILPLTPLESIEVRCFGPNGEDILFRFCSWDGETINSIDGDSYYLDEEISKYEFDGDGNLTYWVVREWT